MWTDSIHLIVQQRATTFSSSSAVTADTVARVKHGFRKEHPSTSSDCVRSRQGYRLGAIRRRRYQGLGHPSLPVGSRRVLDRIRRKAWHAYDRSEEHTSELQSHVNLVCRLLLEKKKKKNENNNL